MVALEFASSIQAVALRVCKLDTDGSPLVGAQNAFVTSQFSRVSFTPEYEEGEEISDKNAAGVQCVYYKMPDTLKSVTLEIAICNPQPEFYEMLADGTLLTKTGATVGWASPLSTDEANANGLGLEVWSRAIVGGRPASVNPYWRWVFPFIQTRMNGERVLENGAMAHVFSGQGLGNAAFGNGPQNDWEFTSAAAVQYARDSTAPTGIDNYQAVISD